MKHRKLGQAGRDLLERSFGSDLSVYEFGENGSGWPKRLSLGFNQNLTEMAGHT